DAFDITDTTTSMNTRYYEGGAAHGIVNSTQYGFDVDFRDHIGDVTLYGGQYGDSLVGGQGDDFLAGGAGANTMAGGKGDDTFYTGFTGNDAVYGGSGSDVFHFQFNSGTARTISTLAGFDQHDTIDLG